MSGGIACKAGWLIDGSGSPIRHNAVLQITQGLVHAIGPADHGSDPAIPGPLEELLNFSDCTLLPPLIDSHVHLCMSGTIDPAERQGQLDNPYAAACVLIREHLQEHWKHGILAVRDGGDHHGHVVRFLHETAFEKLTPVVVRCAGRAFHQAGRYGRLIGRPPSPGQPLAEAVALDAEPKNHLKIVNSGLNSLKEFGRKTQSQFDLAELTAAVAAARKKGLDTMIHANGEGPVRDSVMAGCRSIEHGFFMGMDNLKRMADHGTIWVPTAVTMAAYAAVTPLGSLEQTVAQKNLDHQLEQMAAAQKAGVLLAVGTDAASPGVHHGRALRDELGLFMAAGYSIMEAVKCAAKNGADLLGLEGRGQIKAGRPADFIVVKGSPKDLPGSLKQIQAIYLNGQLRYEAGCKNGWRKGP